MIINRFDKRSKLRGVHRLLRFEFQLTENFFTCYLATFHKLSQAKNISFCPLVVHEDAAALLWNASRQFGDKLIHGNCPRFIGIKPIPHEFDLVIVDGRGDIFDEGIKFLFVDARGFVLVE